MKKSYMSAAAMALIFAATGAMAQPDRNDRGGRDNHSGGHGQQQSRPSQPAQRPQTHRPDQQQTRPMQQQNWPQFGNNNRPDFNNNRPNFNRPNFNNNRPHARPDYSKYRRMVTSPNRYRAGIYHAPRGYTYRRWNHGQYLPSTYFARSFWLTNFIAYGLFAPPSDAVWVRYGPDALLVDRYNGEVISVRYNVFY